MQHVRPFRLCRLLLAPVLMLLVAATVGAQGSDGAGPKSTMQGAYSETQASTGGDVFRLNCTSCHNASILTGQSFQLNWAGRTAFDLYERMRTTMPLDDPGRLSPQEYADIVAYLFKINGYPAGNAVLPPDRERLKQLRIDAKSESASP
jgi:S-disulfanyl-L-cysteine oxidoreductase SoxD